MYSKMIGILTISIGLVFSVSFELQAKPKKSSTKVSSEFCQIMKKWIRYQDTKDPKKLCKILGNKEGFCSSAKNNGQAICMASSDHDEFCSSVMNDGQGICAISKKHSGFCSNVANTAMGICQALGKSWISECSDIDDSDLDEWIEHLIEACPDSEPKLF